MDIKINKRLLSIPPFISTSWKNVQSIGMDSKKLQLILADGSIVEIPDLEPKIIENIFTTHAQVLEEGPLNAVETSFAGLNPQRFGEGGENIFQIGFAALDELGTVMQHNPAHANAPNLPSHVLEKIGAVARAMAPDDVHALPKAEPNCNCMHCQIARAIIKEIDPQSIEDERESIIDIADVELVFQEWEIQQSGDAMFTVSNKLDPHERYTVYLGSPVGCTCGKANCEHIVAVLKS